MEFWDIARNASHYTNRVLSLGAANKGVLFRLESLLDMEIYYSEAEKNGVELRKKYIDKFKKKTYVNGKEAFVLSFNMFPEIEKLAIQAKTGACGEFAVVTFQYLRRTHRFGDEGNPPIELVKAPGHWMVVFNRSKQTNLKDPATWNNETWICDAWGRKWNTAYYHVWSIPPVAALRYPDDYPKGEIAVGDWMSW